MSCWGKHIHVDLSKLGTTVRLSVLEDLWNVTVSCVIIEKQSLICPRWGSDLIPGRSVWNLWWKTWHGDIVFSQYVGFPCHYQSSNAPYSSSSTRRCRKDTRTKPGNLSKSSALFGSREALDIKSTFSCYSPQEVKGLMCTWKGYAVVHFVEALRFFFFFL